jgi:phage terminase small subunit
LATKTSKRLTEKEQLFVAEYLISFNASDAYRKAGYKGKSANQLAYRLLTKPHIQYEVQKQKKSMIDKIGLTQEMVLAEICKVGFASMRQFMHIDAEGQPQINLTDTPDDDLDALSETSTETILEKTGMDADGKPVFSQVRKTKIKLHDKLNALEKLARYTGVFEKEAELAAGAFADAISDIQSRMSKAPIRRYTAQDDDK